MVSYGLVAYASGLETPHSNDSSLSLQGFFPQN